MLIKESVYYIVLWLLLSCLKNSRCRRYELRVFMVDPYESSLMGKIDADMQCISTNKVVETMDFCGLHFVSSGFYQLIL